MHLRLCTPRLLGVAAMFVTLAMSLRAGAAIAQGPILTNTIAAEQQRILQFYQAEQSYQEKLKVGRARYTQKQLNRAQVLAAMSSELQARQQTVGSQPGAGAVATIDEPAGWSGPSLTVAALALGLIGLACYLKRQRA